jgi:hypothetical protein
MVYLYLLWTGFHRKITGVDIFFGRKYTEKTFVFYRQPWYRTSGDEVPLITARVGLMTSAEQVSAAPES